MHLSQIEADLKELCEVAIKNGATSAKAIDVKQVVVDERVLLKCRIPQCMYYGQNRMCPPYTPTPRKFKEYLSKYTYAVMVQVETAYPEILEKPVRREGAKLSEVARELQNILKPIDPVWKKLHAIVGIVEKEAFNRGYYFSSGLGPTTCRLCDKCDATSPCKHPFEARPSMEAVGIDVFATSKNAGLETRFPVGDKIVLTGLILVG